MIKKIFIPLLFLFSFIYGQYERENSNNIVQRGGLLYSLDSYSSSGPDEGLLPYSGLVFTLVTDRKFGALSSQEKGSKNNPTLILKYESNYGSYVREEYLVLNGAKHGSHKIWDKLGRLESDRNYKNGVLHGLNISYFSSGQPKEEGIAKDGKRDGLFKTYEKNGQLKKEETYKDGVLIETKKY